MANRLARIGDIVLFYAPEPTPRAAVIPLPEIPLNLNPYPAIVIGYANEVGEVQRVRLQVFPTNHQYLHPDAIVPFSEEPANGCWSWRPE